MIHNINIWFAGYLICGNPKGLQITGWEPLEKHAKGKERQKISGFVGEIYTISAIYYISDMGKEWWKGKAARVNRKVSSDGWQRMAGSDNDSAQFWCWNKLAHGMVLFKEAALGNTKSVKIQGCP